MASVLIRNIDDETKIKLQHRAKRNGHSLEAELRIVLKEAAVGEDVKPAGIGTELVNLFTEYGLIGMDLELPPRQISEPMSFDE